jgi:hypothetical protein
MEDDLDTFFLKQLFETGRIAPHPVEPEPEPAPKPLLRDRIAAFFGRKLAGA